MSRARSVAVFLTAITLASPGAALGQGANGAGDEEYGDPFTEEPSTGTSTSGTQTSGSDGLTQDPNLGIEGSSDPLVPADPSSSEATGTSLPNTGSDPRLIILAGGSLLLFGFGLRLRTADEVF